MRIVLDAMGSDDYPAPEVQAAVEAAQKFGLEILLVGQQEKLTPMLAEANQSAAAVRVVHAPKVFTMTDKISAGKLRKAETSMAVGLELVKAGEADAFVTAGNTGGAMANGLAQLRRIRGVKRPALSAMLPVRGGHCVALDIGANAECKPEFLLQFAIMGSIYAEKMLGKKNPRVGLLSNGEEAGKGNDLVKATYPLLAAADIHFIGNVESKEVYGGETDVVVTDGFTGNILIKTSEAVAKLMTERLKEEIMATTTRKLGGLLVKPAFDALRKDLDPAEVGAAPLLGLNGLTFVGHGRSDARALVNAIDKARQAVAANLLESLQNAIETRLKNIQTEETE
ncbi:MAG: phosphate acyltransferase PlsX [Anaerolineales bacterium]|nr:phosphate acyltransferase PlsX [Anaerolineales bacterium]